MKLLVVLTLFFSITSIAQEQAPVAVTPFLTCRDFNCIMGQKCGDANSREFDLKLRKLNQQGKAVLLSNNQQKHAAGRVVQPKKNDRLVVNFDSGDRIERFQFLRQDIDRVRRQQAQTLQGLHIKGFKKPDGEHTESIYVAHCRPRK